MTSTPDLDDLARRPEKYWHVDGLPDVMMGVLWMTWGGAWLVGQALLHGSAYSLFWSLTPLLLAGSGLAMVWAVKRLKARLTFPRTGYVDWKDPPRSARLIAGGAAMIVAVVLVWLGARSGSPEGRAIAPILGVILSIAFLGASVRFGAPHYLVLAGIAVALGFALGRITRGWDGANWLFIGIGAASVLSGAARFAMFVKHHPRSTLQAP